MGHIYIQYGTSIYAVRDISQYRMGHLSIQDGNLYMQYVTVITVWDIYLYGTYISMQYGTYIYSVWDIYLYSMGHLSIVWDIYVSNMGHLPA